MTKVPFRRLDGLTRGCYRHANDLDLQKFNSKLFILADIQCSISWFMSTIVENHVPNSGAASIGAVLPSGIGEFREIGIWNAIVKADFIDGIRSAVRIEFEGIGRVGGEGNR